MTARPRYEDIAEKLRERIEAGEWPPGSDLPTLDTLTEQYDAGRNTIHRAIGVLETEGYVWAVQGRSVAVRYGTIRPRRPRGNLVKRNTQATGYSFPSASAAEKWQKHGEANNDPAALDDPRIARLLGVPAGAVVPRRFRITGPVGEAPFQVSTTWIRPDLADLVASVDANPAAGEWLYHLEQAGHWPISWVEISRARMPSKQEAAWLEIPTSLPVLEIVRQGVSGGDERPVEVTECVLASDRVEIVQILERDEDARQPWPQA